MKARNNSLSETQKNFIEFLNLHIRQNKRVIYCNCKGHIGMGYAICSYFPKAKILHFHELKTEPRTGFVFRVLEIISAVVSFFLKNSKDIDLGSVLNPVINNLENILLQIQKEHESLKVLNVKRKSHKMGKIRFFVYVNKDDISSEEDISTIYLLSRLITDGRITGTILFISRELHELARNMKCDISDEVFFLKSTDLDTIIENNDINSNINVEKTAELVSQFGIQFFLDNHRSFEALITQKDSENWVESSEWVISRILKYNEIDRDDIYPLLEFASFFEHFFTKVDIQNLKDPNINVKNVDLAVAVSFIRGSKGNNEIIPHYTFVIDGFRRFFHLKYNDDLMPEPFDIYLFMRKYYPFDYIAIMHLFKLNSSILDYDEIQGLALLGYYHVNRNKIIDTNDFLRNLPKDSITTSIINFYEDFKAQREVQPVNLITDKLLKSNMETIAKCAGLTMILQIVKECFDRQIGINFTDILLDFKAEILSIDSSELYIRYWKVHFMCQYIAFSLEDERTDNSTARKFLYVVKNARDDVRLSSYISEYDLKGFLQIDLLSNSLMIENANEVIKKLFYTAERSSIIKELARINYSALLIEGEQYKEAVKILETPDSGILRNINGDTYTAYLNNKYLSEWMTFKISLDTYIMKLEKLLNNFHISTNDRYIVENNLYSAYLQSDSEKRKKGIEKLFEIVKSANTYGKFFACHNLWAYYFDKDGSELQACNIPEPEIPKLLSTDKTYFLNKLKWLKDNKGKHNFNEFPDNPHVCNSYKRLYLFGAIERWFE